ncbi:MAG: hypothetical protein AYK19_15980 [Theionarchaea archaeon DG-70-1]|nr:MAG: hypothetical protein AYK19_15980 [Theionarchaea archaeon DG-70-1]
MIIMHINNIYMGMTKIFTHEEAQSWYGSLLHIEKRWMSWWTGINQHTSNFKAFFAAHNPF